MTIPATGVTYRDLRGTISFDNDQITIAELSGTDGARGAFEIGGRIEMQNQFGNPRHRDERRDLQVIDLSRQDVQVHAALRLTGTTESLAGRVVVDEAIYRMPERSNKDIIDLDKAVIDVDILALVDSTSRSKSLAVALGIWPTRSRAG